MEGIERTLLVVDGDSEQFIKGVSTISIIETLITRLLACWASYRLVTSRRERNVSFLSQRRLVLNVANA